MLTDDTRFRESHIRVTAIATSSGQNDNGMFEMNFRDERYLPFEGGGAVSTWQIELVADRSLRQFDYDTLSDVILHLRYTAREDAGQFKDAAVGHLQTVLQNSSPGLRLRRMFDLRREFATEWYAFLRPAPGGHKTLQPGRGRGRGVLPGHRVHAAAVAGCRLRNPVRQRRLSWTVRREAA